MGSPLLMLIGLLSIPAYAQDQAIASDETASLTGLAIGMGSNAEDVMGALPASVQESQTSLPGEVVCLTLVEAFLELESSSSGTTCQLKQMLPCISELSSPMCPDKNQEDVEELFGIDQDQHGSKTLYDLQNVVLKQFTGSEICRGTDPQGTCIHALLGLPIVNYADFLSAAITKQRNDRHGSVPHEAHMFAALTSATEFVEVGPPLKFTDAMGGDVLIFLATVVIFLAIIGGIIWHLRKNDLQREKMASAVKNAQMWLNSLPSTVTATFSTGLKSNALFQRPPAQAKPNSSNLQQTNQALQQKLTMLRELRTIGNMNKDSASAVGV